MRGFALAFCLALCSMSAPTYAADDWTKNRSLFWPETPISLKGKDIEGNGFTTFRFFSAMTSGGGKCQSTDNEKGRVVVTCAGPSKLFHKSAVISGEFVGAGYLGVDTIVVDGDALPLDKRAAFFNRVLAP